MYGDLGYGQNSQILAVNFDFAYFHRLPLLAVKGTVNLFLTKVMFRVSVWIFLLTESPSSGRLLGSKRKKFAASTCPRTFLYITESSSALDSLLDVK